jgi:hypothetical protein
MPTEQQVIILTSLAVIGCAGTVIADILLLGRPISGAKYFCVYPTTMAEVSFGRLWIGNTAGLVIFPLELCGVWLLHQVLRYSDERLAWIVLLTLGFTLLGAITVHCTSAFLGTGLRVQRQLNNDVTNRMVQQLTTYRQTFSHITLVALIIGSIVFVVHVLMQATPFPKWMAIVNPLILVALVRYLTALLPAPIGGYIAPGYFNIAMLLFFIANFIVIQHSGIVA